MSNLINMHTLVVEQQTETKALVCSGPTWIYSAIAWSQAALGNGVLCLFDAASTGAVTLGTTTPDLFLPAPAGSWSNWGGNEPITFAQGLVIAATLDVVSASAPSSDLRIFIQYQNAS